MLKLKANKRDNTEKPDSIREAGLIPAVFYGPKEEAQSIKIKSIDFEKTFKEAGESTIVNLDVDGTEHEVLIHDVDVHPVSGKIMHADFYVIERGKKLQVNVSLEFVGVAPAEKTMGGTLVKVMHEIEIESMPRHLPQHIDVDLSTLVDFDSKITIADLKLPEGVEATGDPEEVIALVQERREEPEEPEEAVDISSIEVEKKGKKEEESEE